MAGHYKRHFKNFFINREFQGRVALVIFLTLLLSCILFIALLAIFSSDSMTISYSNNDIQLGKTPFMLFKSAAAANWVFLLLGGTFLVCASIIGTHRIAGPHYRLEKTISKMAHGDLSTSVNLRDKDEGKDLAEKINLLNDNYSSNLKEIHRSCEAVDNLLTQYGNLDERLIKPEDATSICQAIRTHNNKIRSHVSYFTLKSE